MITAVPIAMKTALDAFQFQIADGSTPRIDVGGRDVGFWMRISKRGRPVLVFPPPYAIEIAEGERVSSAKWQRIQAATAALLRA